MDNVIIDIIEQVTNVNIAVTETPNIVTIVETGTRGPQGLQGTSGCGVPTGGSAGYLLVKKSNTDYDTQWVIQDEDIQQYPSISNFPPIGEDSILYIDLSNYTSWVWNSSATIPTYIGVGGLGNLPAGENKQIQYNDLGRKGASVNFQFDKDSQAVLIGSGTLLSTNPLSISGNVDSYLQVNIQNTNGSGIHASSDIVASNDVGNDASGYIDMGINGSQYNDPAYSATSANDGYLIINGGNLVLETTKQEISFAVGGTTLNSIMGKINGSGLQVPVGNNYKIGNFNVTDLITSASSQEMEDMFFSLGSKLVIRTDLL